MPPQIAYNEQDAWDQIDQITTCSSCIHFARSDLFTGSCVRLGGSVGNGERCEEFYSSSKKESYWIDKLVEMAQEFSGQNDFFRQLDFHEKNGTIDQFLSTNTKL